MKAAVLARRHVIELRDLEPPEIDRSEVLVRVEAVGVCGSDVAVFNGCHPYKRPPIVLGHELCGRIERVGADVKSLAPGDRVCSMSYAPCMGCVACQRGESQLCEAKRALSHAGWQGAFAEKVVLDEGMVFELPDEVVAEAGALVEPLSIGLHAVDLAGSDLQRVAILGSGSIGLASLVAACQRGAERVVTTDLGPDKRRRALRLGATAYVDAEEPSLVERVVSALGGSADAVVVAVGAPGVVDDAVRIAKRGGTVVIVGYFDGAVSVDLNACVQREVSLRSSCLSNGEDFREVISWLAQGSFDAHDLISHRFRLLEAQSAVELVASGEGGVAKVMLQLDAADTLEA